MKCVVMVWSEGEDERVVRFSARFSSARLKQQLRPFYPHGFQGLLMRILYELNKRSLHAVFVVVACLNGSRCGYRRGERRR